MANRLLDIDLGEFPNKGERLYTYTQAANLACGGHTGDERSMLGPWIPACTIGPGFAPLIRGQAHFGHQDVAAPEVPRA
jgi:lactam utilization protein B